MDNANNDQKLLDTLAVENFREYLRIPSVHPNVNYDGCVQFLTKLAKDIDLQHRVYEYVPKKPIVVISWIGQKPNLPSILLNSHMDVVAANEELWTHKPFDADIDEKNDIYGRGTQDVKSIGIQYLEAIRRLKNDGYALARTVHVSYTPDEEIGGHQGMAKFVQSEDFRNLNVGFAMDEAFTNETDVMVVASGEKTAWQFRVHCPGQPGHGSQLFDNTAGEKVQIVLNRYYMHRKQMVEKLKNSGVQESDVLSINLTEMQGGVQVNVLPAELILTFDCRLPVTTDVKEWEDTINRWCTEAGDGVWIEYLQKNALSVVTKLDDNNPYWVAFKKAANKLNLKLREVTLLGITDIRYVRALGIPAIGFSPTYNTTNLEHCNDELLNIDVFLKGITTYYTIIAAIANSCSCM